MGQRNRKRNGSDASMAVAWYRESDWPRVKLLFPDADELHDTHAEWLRSAESLVQHLQRHGIAARPVVVDLDHFIAWCTREGLRPDAEARAAYVDEMLGLQGAVPKSAIDTPPESAQG
jgi:hypothetical protein